MSVLDKKKQVFGEIAAAKTLTSGMPTLKTNSSMPSINNDGNVILFLTDLVKALIGYEALVSALVDTLTHSIENIEVDVKKSIKLELKSIVSCGVNPQIPSWLTSTGNGIIIPVNKIDFLDMLHTPPNSIGGTLMYNDITTPYTISNDFNTFLYGVIQDDGIPHTWQNIIEVTFNSVGIGGNPNNTLTIKTTSNYDTKSLSELNNDFIDSITLFNTENILNKLIDIIYGSVSSFIGKTLKQLESEEKINDIIDKMVNSDTINGLNDSDFIFTNDQLLQQEDYARKRNLGIITVATSTIDQSSVPINNLIDVTAQLTGVTSTIQKKEVITNGLNNMANSSVENVSNISDKNSAKLDFIQQLVMGLVKSIVNIILSPKVLLVFLINAKIIYGQSFNYTDPIDFIKKNKNLLQTIIKDISEELIKILIAIVLKEINKLVVEMVAKKQKEKIAYKIAQLQSLIGVPTNLINDFLNTI